jgi:outer membrane protein assembly factor BamB
MSDDPNRRRLLKTIGASALATSLAGCGGGGDGGDGGDSGDGGDGGGGTDAPTDTDAPAGTDDPGTTADGDDGGDGGEESVDPLGATAWPMTGYDAGYSSAHPDVTALGGSLAERWSVTRTPEGRGGYQDLPIAVGSGHVVAAGPQGTVVAVDAADGTEAWTYEIGERGPPDGGVALFDGTVYIVGDEATHAVDVETGDAVWEDTDGGDSDPVMDDDRLYQLGLNEVYARDLATGAVDWEVRRVAGTRNLAVADGTVYAEVERDGSDWQILAMDAGSGAEQWTSDGVSLDGPRPQFLSADGDAVYVTGDDGFVWSFDADDGSLNWTADPYTADEKGSVEPEQPAVIGPDNVYVIGYSLYAISRSDGSTTWSVGERYDSRNAIAYAGGEVYNATEPGVRAFDPADGTELWQQSLSVDGGCISDLALTDGTMYYSQDDCAAAEPTVGVLEVDDGSE